MNHDIDATIAANAEALEQRRAEAQYYISCAGLSPCYKGESPSGPARTQNVTKVFAASSKSGAVPAKKPRMSRARIEAVKKGAEARRAMAGKLSSEAKQ